MAPSRPLKGGETSFGVFYPQDYVLAIFTDPSAGERAAAALEVAGFPPEDVLVLGSDEVLGWHGRFTADSGLVDRFRKFVVEHFPGGSARLDDVVAHARVGHTFVLAYAPDGATTDRAAAAIRPVHPRVLQKYNAFTVSDLA